MVVSGGDIWGTRQHVSSHSNRDHDEAGAQITCSKLCFDTLSKKKYLYYIYVIL